MQKIFTHKPLVVPKLVRVDRPGLRYYENPETQQAFTSITTLISHNTKHKFVNWRQEKGEKEANRISKRSTTRGTKTHTLIEHYVNNLELPDDATLFPDDDKVIKLLNENETIENYKSLPYFLFENLRPELNKIDNILGLEISLFSEILGLAGTADCIAEYNGVLSIIDYKTSEYIKREDWVKDYFVQALAYRYMLMELTGLDAKQLIIFMAAENGQIKPFIKTQFDPYSRILKRYIDKFTYDKTQESN